MGLVHPLVDWVIKQNCLGPWHMAKKHVQQSCTLASPTWFLALYRTEWSRVPFGKLSGMWSKLCQLTVSSVALEFPVKLLQISEIRLGYFKFGRSQIQIWGELAFGSQNNTPNETNGVNNAVSCYKEALQFSASFVTSLFASSWQNLRNSNGFSIFRHSNTN